MHDLHVGAVGEVLLQRLAERRVELQGDDAAGAAGEGLCQGAEAGTDFDDGVAGGDVGGVGDALEHALGDEEVLTEALAGLQAKATEHPAGGGLRRGPGFSAPCAPRVPFDRLRANGWMGGAGLCGKAHGDSHGLGAGVMNGWRTVHLPSIMNPPAYPLSQLRPGSPAAPGVSAYRCSLPGLAGFTVVRRAGPGPQRRSERAEAAGPDLGEEFDPAVADCGYKAPPAPHLARPIQS